REDRRSAGGRRYARMDESKQRSPHADKRGVEAVCITSALVRTSLLRPSQSAQLSEAIIFFRLRKRNVCADRWRLSPDEHTGQPCEDTMQPATSADTASVALRRLCNIEHIDDRTFGGHGGKAARRGKT